MSDKKEDANSEKVVSAPPVRTDLLRRNKLQPLSSPRPLAVTKSAVKESKDTEDDLPADITDNVETDRAVDAIGSEEADEVLASEDAARGEIEGSMPKHRVRAFFSAWLGTKRGWKWTFLILFVAAALLAYAPKTRYWVLNTVGVRCSLSLTATDSGTSLAIPGVAARDGSVQAVASHSGLVTLHNLKLGSQTIVISRPGFATLTEHVVLGWGGNPLSSFSMKDVGQQYTILVHDYLSGATIASASANDSGLQALADKAGKITLTISGNPSEQPIPITVAAPGYVTKDVTLSGTSTTEVHVSLTPSFKEVYVAEQGGLYNLYSSYIDGADKQVLLAGTSTETSNIALAVSPDSSEAALVSTRDATYDSTGKLLEALTLVNVSSGAPLTLDHAEQIQIIGWSGSTIIYEEQTVDGSSPSYSIISYDYATSSRDQLATSSGFTGAVLAGGTVYYAIPASASTTGDGFYSIAPNGSGKQTIVSQDIWNVLRLNYSNFSLQSSSGWYNYNLGANAASTNSSAPTDLASAQYLNGPGDKQSASVNNGQLQIYTISSGQTRTIADTSGATYPLRWLNAEDIIYRVTSGSDSSDYVVDINSGTPKQIASVTNTTSVAGN